MTLAVLLLIRLIRLAPPIYKTLHMLGREPPRIATDVNRHRPIRPLAINLPMARIILPPAPRLTCLELLVELIGGVQLPHLWLLAAGLLPRCPAQSPARIYGVTPIGQPRQLVLTWQFRLSNRCRALMIFITVLLTSHPFLARMTIPKDLFPHPLSFQRPAEPWWSTMCLQ